MYGNDYNYTPANILLSKEELKNLLLKVQSHTKAETELEKYRNYCITVLLSFVGCIISVISAYDSMNLFLRIITVLISVAVLVVFFYCGRKWWKLRKEGRAYRLQSSNIIDLISGSIRDTVLFTSIIRLTTKDNGEMKYLVDSTDFFLPHCAISLDASLSDQEDNIKQSLNSKFGIQERDILNIKLLEIGGEKLFDSIKPIRGKMRMNAYAFYDIQVDIQSKQRLIKQSENRRWMSINQMKSNASAYASNKDVIDLLETFPMPKDSFINLLGNMKVIWNITSECGYNCSICATADNNRHDLNAAEKLGVLNNIYTAKPLIKTLDFAGGDPLSSKETCDIIQAAIGQFGSEKVSVTTTGKGIEKITSMDYSFSELFKHCEITIDAAHGNLKPDDNTNEISRNEETYCEANIDQINSLLEHAKSLTINVPIINDDLNDDEINLLLDKIDSIKSHHPSVKIDVLLIRLMPVGRLAQTVPKDRYKIYNPINVIRKILVQASERNINCKLHCSLRALSVFSDLCCTEHCSMLEKKIGIDCAGNVFACAWGGYLLSQVPIAKNPFFLGNLTHTPLLDILEGKSRKPAYTNIMSEIKSKQRRNYCSLVSYYASNHLFQNSDYLAKKIL